MGQRPSSEPDKLDIVPGGSTPGVDDAPAAAAAAVPAAGTGAGDAPAPAPAGGDAPARRGPGRPPKRAPQAGGGAGSVGAPTRLRVDTAAKSKRRPTPPAAPKAAPVDTTALARETVTTVLGMADFAALMLAGPGAGITPDERAMVEPAAVRMLARMSPAAVARYGGLMDPLALAIGLGMWGMRVASIASERASQRANVAATVQEPPPDPGAPESPQAATERPYVPNAPDARVPVAAHPIANGVAAPPAEIAAWVDESLS